MLKQHPKVLLAVTLKLKLIEHNSYHKTKERESLREVRVLLHDRYYDSLKEMVHPPQKINDSELADWHYQVLQSQVPAISLAYNSTNIPSKTMPNQLLTLPKSS